MKSKILLSMVILTSVVYSIGCCWNDCRFIGGATYELTYPDGSKERVESTTETDGSGCISHDCDKGDPTKFQLVVNPQV